MKIEPISSGRLRVWLDQREIRRCRLNSEHYDRRALRRLVRHALSQGGGEPSAETVAEMIPVADGWVLLISSQQERAHRCVVYWFGDKEALDAFIVRWESLPNLPTCALYRVEDGYALAVYGDGDLAPLHRCLLDEYGQLWGAGEPLAAHAAEYGQLLCAGYFTAGGHHPPIDEGQGN